MRRCAGLPGCSLWAGSNSAGVTVRNICVIHEMVGTGQLRIDPVVRDNTGKPNIHHDNGKHNSIKASRIPTDSVSKSSTHQTMRSFFLAVIIASTASMSASACKQAFQSCTTDSDCCGATTACLKFVSRNSLFCIRLMTHLLRLVISGGQ